MTKPSITVNPSYVLLVEAEDDRNFFEQVCKSFNLNPNITVAPPKDFKEKYDNKLRNTKQGVLNLLKKLLVQLPDEEGAIKRLAIIIDADHEKEQGLGYQKTIEQVCNIAADFDFTLTEYQGNGLSFKHNDGFAEFGLWVMPNNHTDGMLEDFIKTCVSTEEQSLFNHAIHTVQNVLEPKFKPHHYSKAEVATWLAWQNPPGHGLYYTVKDDLLNTNHPLFQDLAQWLKKIFT